MRSLLALLLLVPTMAFAGKPCAGIKVSKDEFTGDPAMSKRVSLNGWNAFGTDTKSPFTLEIAVEVQRGVALFRPVLATPGISEGTISPGWAWDVKTKAGDILTVTTTEDTILTGFALGSLVVTRHEPRFALDAATLGKLAASPMEVFRIKLPTGESNVRAHSALVSGAQKAFACAASLVK